jgi:uncharacterized protein YjiS (DUF1127 family)
MRVGDRKKPTSNIIRLLRQIRLHTMSRWQKMQRTLLEARPALLSHARSDVGINRRPIIISDTRLDAHLSTLKAISGIVHAPALLSDVLHYFLAAPRLVGIPAFLLFSD